MTKLEAKQARLRRRIAELDIIIKAVQAALTYLVIQLDAAKQEMERYAPQKNT